MLVFNQQANIKNVNGAIADTFANRPAAQSTFYLFYATDTQEIYYDNGAWVLLGTGNVPPPPPTTNIYNSNGSLNNNRTLSGDWLYDLSFGNLTGVNIYGGVQFGYKSQFIFDNNSTSILAYEQNINSAFEIRKNGTYQDILIGTYDTNNANKGGLIKIDNQNNIIGTNHSVNDWFNNIYIGLKLDFANQQYILGDIINLNSAALFVDAIQGSILGYEANVGSNGINVVPKFGNVTLGDFGAVGNQTILQIDDQSQLIKSSYQGNDIGLKLDFASQNYRFGDPVLLQTWLEIDNTPAFYFNTNGINNCSIQTNTQLLGHQDVVLFLEQGNGAILGDYNNANNGTILFIQPINQLIKTQNAGQFDGIEIDFNAGVYRFGDYSNFQNFGLITIAGNDVLLQGGGNNPLISIENTNSLIKTRFSGSDNGVYLDFSNEIYRIGQITGSNTSQLVVDDSNEQVYTTFGGNAKGIVLDAASNIYQFGRITGGNTTYIEIADGNAYPVQISGTNVTAGTAGGASGVHLKIKINGVDYKIELRNP